MTDLTLSQPIFSTGEAAAVGKIDVTSLDNWAEAYSLGTLVTHGKRTFRKFSPLDLIHLRLTTALAGPATLGTRARTFLMPASACGLVRSLAPLHRFIDWDDEGGLKPLAPVAEQKFILKALRGRRDICTYGVYTGAEVLAGLGDIDHQMLLVPASKLAREVIIACAEMKEPKPYPTAVEQLEQQAAEAVDRITIKTPAPEPAEEEDFTAELKREVLAALRAKGLVEDDE